MSTNERPESPSVSTKLDPEIALLVKALADSQTVTLSSCCGHGEGRAYVDLAVHGMKGLRHFVERLNHVQEAIGEEGWLDVSLNWSNEVATCCDFETWPDWIMLSLTIEGPDGLAPNRRLLAKVAQLYKQSKKVL